MPLYVRFQTYYAENYFFLHLRNNVCNQSVTVKLAIINTCVTV